MNLRNIILPSPPSNTPNHSTTTYDIEVSNHVVKSIPPHTHSPEASSAGTSSASCSPPSLLLPTLCHPHIHLDKPYLLTSNYNHPAAYPACCPRHQVTSSQPPNDDQIQTEKQTQASLPDYSGLAPKSGSFPEALQLTSKAKQLYTTQDLYLRGRQLLATSYTQGVTSVRGFVEVDHVTGHHAVDVGLTLRKEFEGRGLMRIQLCAFAQDPLLSTEHGDGNRRVLEEVLAEHTAAHEFEGRVVRGVEVLGTTPYVEESREAAIKNIEWAVKTAMSYDLHLDFHLDYNLDESKAPAELMVWEVLRLLEENRWPRRGVGHGKVNTVVLGHCSALTLLPHEGPYSLTSLARKLRESGLPVYFVGLPTSDLYMMGRPGEDQDKPLNRPRGTLNILSLTKDYGLKGLIGVNNVGNAFTPFGNGDPLELAGWCVGIYQGGGEGDAERLYGMVSKEAREAIGLEIVDGNEKSGEGEGVVVGDEGSGQTSTGSPPLGKEFEVNEGMDIGEFGLMLVRNEVYIGGKELEDVGMKVPARRRVGVRDVVRDVPEVRLRSIVR